MDHYHCEAGEYLEGPERLPGPPSFITFPMSLSDAVLFLMGYEVDGIHFVRMIECSKCSTTTSPSVPIN